MHTVFTSYSRQDHGHLIRFRQHAHRLELEGLCSVWHDQEVMPGEPWAQRIRDQLEGSRLVVALLSPDFLESHWCVAELERALELRDRELLDVVPIVVRQCDWRSTALGAIQALPSGGAPIETWPDPEMVWSDVALGLERALRGERLQPAYPSRDELVARYAGLLEADRRLMLLAPWRAGLEEISQEVARRTHGDSVTTLRIPPLEHMSESDFYSELSGSSDVRTPLSFRQWLRRRSAAHHPKHGHLLVVPYFGGPRDLVKSLGDVMRAVFDETGGFSLLVVGLARCAALKSEVASLSLFSGILTEHVPGMDLEDTRTLLRRMGADGTHASRVQIATGGHPEWTALAASEVRQGRLHGLSQYLANTKLYGVLSDRISVRSRAGHKDSAIAETLRRLLAGKAVTRLGDVRDDLSFPEVRLYYDGVVVERSDRTEFRCDAARLAADRALRVWSQAP